GQDIAPTDLAELLIDAGYTREDPADEHGEFAVRGGILDVFPAGESQPVRLEFIGDTIESLRTYDPATQRSVAAIDQLTIVPLRNLFIAWRKPRATSDIAGPDSRAAGETEVAQDVCPADLDRTATIFDYLALARDV